MIIGHAKDRIDRYSLSPTETMVLRTVVAKEAISVKDLSKLLGKKSNQISAILSKLLEYHLVGYRREARQHFYYPAIDAAIAYSAD